MTGKPLSRPARFLQGVIVSLPCFFLASVLLRTWMDPMSVDGGRWVRFGVGILALEFVLVHAGGMLAALRMRRNIGTLKLCLAAFAFYSLFAGAMALAFQSCSLYLIFSIVMVTRFIGLFTEPDVAAKEAQHRSGISVLFYLLAAFASVMVPFPEWGVTTEVLNEVYPDRGGGVWEQSPETALAAGVIYFTLLGLTELLAGLRRPKEKKAQAHKAAS